MVFVGGVADGARLKLKRGGSPRKRRSSMADMTELAALAPTPTPPLKGRGYDRKRPVTVIDPAVCDAPKRSFDDGEA